VILADARHPLFHFPPSLYNYVIDDLKKPLVLVLNKIDLVTDTHVERWMDYFSARFPALKVIPFTSHPRLDEDGELINNGFLPREDDLSSKKIKRTKKGVPSSRRHKVVVGATPLIASCVQHFLDSRRTSQETVDQDSASASQASSVSNDIKKMLQVVDEEPEDSDLSHDPADDFEDDSDDNDEEEEGDDLSDDSDDKEDRDALDDDDDNDKKKKRNSRSKSKDVHSDQDHLYPVHTDDDDDDDDGNDNHETEDDNDDDDDNREKEKKTRKEGRSQHLDQYGRSRGPGRPKKVVEPPPESSSPLDEIEKFSADGSEIITIGTLGHPNVGKSSLINGLKKKKVVSTSRTPGHTKHFQTIFLNNWLRLCDCPGLVFPALDMRREMQIVCGLYPLSQIREPYSAVHFLAERVELERVYGLQFPPSDDLIPRPKVFDSSQRRMLKSSLTNPPTLSSLPPSGSKANSSRKGPETLSDDEDSVISRRDRSSLTSSSSSSVDPRDTDEFWENIHGTDKKGKRAKAKAKPGPKRNEKTTASATKGGAKRKDGAISISDVSKDKQKDSTNPSLVSDLQAPISPPAPSTIEKESSKPQYWSGWKICEAYAIKRCYRTRRDRPDVYRAGLSLFIFLIFSSS